MPSVTWYNTLKPEKQALIVSQLMDLFKSNKRGYGIGEFSGAKFNEDKQKWTPGGVRWVWGETVPEQWHAHLCGEVLIGQGVLCDDNRVWYSCLDVDNYTDVDYHDEMAKIKTSGLPLVVFRTKSGGLRVCVFFKEPIDADIVIPRMKRLSAYLGYAGCEIFPKQTKLDVEHGDCPSWIYMPYGGTRDMFPEQGCMNELGNLMLVDECVNYAMDRRLTETQFKEMFAIDDAKQANGKANGKKHSNGLWTEESTYEETLNASFYGGPVCLWIIAHQKSHHMQNNFLLNVATFAKKKYPENWPKFVAWVNYNVLQPVGDSGKLEELINSEKKKDYNYRCHDEPIVGFCDASACRLKKWGVGNANGNGNWDPGLTIIEREPRIVFAQIGEHRVLMQMDDLLSQQRLVTKCAQYGGYPPPPMKVADWQQFIFKLLEDATKVPPSPAMRSHASETEMMTTWFNIHLHTWIRIGDRDDRDIVRIRWEEGRVYYKWKAFGHWLRTAYGDKEVERIRLFQESKLQHHKDQMPGIHRWWRSTYSISFDMLDELEVEKWTQLREQDDENQQA